MGKRKSGVLVFLMLSSCVNLFAQGVRYPDHSILYESNNLYFNNSLQLEDRTILLGNQGYTGSFSEVNLFYAMASISIGKRREQGVSFALYSLQEGPLIAENRLKGGFWKKYQARDYAIVVGGQVGGINTSFGSTRSTPGANAWNIDLDFGVSYLSEKQNFSLSFNQMAETEASPLSQTTQFKRFWTILYCRDITLSSRLKVIPVAYSYNIFGGQHLINGKLLFRLIDKYSAGLGYGTEGLIFNLEMNELMFSKGHTFDLKAGFRVPSVGSFTPISQAFLIELKYMFSKE